MKLFLLLALVTSSAHAVKEPSTIIYDTNKSDVVECRECNVTRPIASLTKVMTALVALEYDSNLSKEVKIGGGQRLPPGINTRGDIFTAMLVRSDNYSADLLAQDYPGGRKAFIQAMNNRAKELGMASTRFVDPSGLGSGNVSTVGELATLISVASLQPIIADTSILRQVEIKNKKYKVLLDNTNKALLATFDEIKFSKTGFTNPAGWNVGMILERQGKKFVVIVLGAKNKEHRYNLAKSLIEKHFADIEFEIELEKQQEEKKLYQRMIDWLSK